MSKPACQPTTSFSASSWLLKHVYHVSQCLFIHCSSLSAWLEPSSPFLQSGSKHFEPNMSHEEFCWSVCQTDSLCNTLVLSLTIGLMAMKYLSHAFQRMELTVFGDPLIFNLVDSLGEMVLDWSQWNLAQISMRGWFLMTLMIHFIYSVKYLNLLC